MLLETPNTKYVHDWSTDGRYLLYSEIDLKANRELWALPVTGKIAILAIMKIVTALEAKNRFGEVLEAAQRLPVSITGNGRRSVVMISAESNAGRQKMARERLRQAIDSSVWIAALIAPA